MFLRSVSSDLKKTKTGRKWKKREKDGNEKKEKERKIMMDRHQRGSRDMRRKRRTEKRLVTPIHKTTSD